MFYYYYFVLQCIKSIYIFSCLPWLDRLANFRVGFGCPPPPYSLDIYIWNIYVIVLLCWNVNFVEFITRKDLIWFDLIWFDFMISTCLQSKIGMLCSSLNAIWLLLLSFIFAKVLFSNFVLLWANFEINHFCLFELWNCRAKQTYNLP